ncbi:rpl27a [Nucleospora cyclopteri]
MIFKENMIVVCVKGRFAGKKAAVMKVLEDGYVIVGGINRVPSDSTEQMAAWEKRKCQKMLTFVKRINIKHLIATRYKTSISLTSVNLTKDISDKAYKTEVNSQVNKMLKDAYENDKKEWIFTTLAI